MVRTVGLSNVLGYSRCARTSRDSGSSTGENRMWLPCWAMSVELPESREVRAQRLYPRTLLKPAVRTMLVPVPKADGAQAGAGRAAPARPVSLGAPALRDQDLLAWCEELIEAVLGGIEPAAQRD